MADTYKFDDAVIQVFFKIPESGKVKTRLIPAIGADAAAALAAEMIDRILTDLGSARLASLELWVSGEDVTEWRGKSVKLQYGDDLGTRMQHALASGISAYGKAVLVGVDCPGIDRQYIAAALAALDTHDVVLGPAEDGGYGLVGVAGCVPAMFGDIPWGGDQVLIETCRVLNQHRLNYHLLPLIWDVDRPEDLARYAAHCEQIESS